MSMEAENRNCNKDVMIIHNKNDIYNTKYCFESYIYFYKIHFSRKHSFRGQIHFEGKFLQVTIKLR